VYELDAVLLRRSDEGLDTRNVTSMHSMFMKATSFDQPVGGLNTSNVIDKWGMFYNTSSWPDNIE